MVQTWTIKGQTYTHAQLMELKAQGLDPRKDSVVMKHITKDSKGKIVGKASKEEKAEQEQKKAERNAAKEKEEAARIESEKTEKAAGDDEYAKQLAAERANETQDAPAETPAPAVEPDAPETPAETLEEEFARLKKERAWKNADKKARYAELKAMFTK